MICWSGTRKVFLVLEFGYRVGKGGRWDRGGEITQELGVRSWVSSR